jgi:hypothetical protein
MSGEDESHERGGNGGHEKDHQPRESNDKEGRNFQADADPTEEAGRRKQLSAREDAYRREGLLFPGLARELSLKVYESQHQFRHNGLPPENIICGLLLSTFYHHLSSRRADFIMVDAVGKGYIRRKPSPNTLL